MYNVNQAILIIIVIYYNDFLHDLVFKFVLKRACKNAANAKEKCYFNPQASYCQKLKTR